MLLHWRTQVPTPANSHKLPPLGSNYSQVMCTGIIASPHLLPPYLPGSFRACSQVKCTRIIASPHLLPPYLPGLHLPPPLRIIFFQGTFTGQAHRYTYFSTPSTPVPARSTPPHPSSTLVVQLWLLGCPGLWKLSTCDIFYALEALLLHSPTQLPNLLAILEAPHLGGNHFEAASDSVHSKAEKVHQDPNS